MEVKELLTGLCFAMRHKLTVKEIEVLIPFIRKPYTTADLAEELKAHPTTLNHILIRLKLKGILTVKEKDEHGIHLLQFNEDVLKPAK